MPTPPTGWVTYLPLSTPTDVRRRLLTPDALLQVNAAPDTAFGVTVATSIFTSGIPHGFDEWTAIQFESSGDIPAPLLPNVTYYARDASTPTTFKVASVIGGSAITITDSGAGQVSVRNWGLNDLIASKIELADEYIYDSLLAMVMDHIRPWSMNTFYGYFPAVGYGNLPSRTPRDRAVIVLDNLINPEALVWASCDVAMWLMTKDGASRKQIGMADTMYDKGPALVRQAQKDADDSIEMQARLLTVDTASGAFGLFNFDSVTDSFSVSLL